MTYDPSKDPMLQVGPSGDDFWERKKHEAEQEKYINELRRQVAEYKRDAERYRFIRDNPWEGTDSVLESVIVCQMNGVWDSTIDAAMEKVK